MVDLEAEGSHLGLASTFGFSVCCPSAISYKDCWEMMGDENTLWMNLKET